MEEKDRDGAYRFVQLQCHKGFRVPVLGNLLLKRSGAATKYERWQ
jgi:hypothetical protein